MDITASQLGGSLKSLFERAIAQGLSKDAQERLRWIAYFVEHGHSVSETCAHFGVTRGTFHRWMKRFRAQDLTTLEEKSHQPHTVRQSTVPSDIVAIIREYRRAQPLIGKDKLAELLLQEHAIRLSSSSIARVIERECLYFADTPLHWRKRVQDEHANAQLHEASVTEQPIMAALPTMAVSSVCTCFICRVRRWNWRSFRHAFLVASILSNLAIVIAMLVTMFWERSIALPNQTSAPEVTLDISPDATLHAAPSPSPKQP